MKYYMAMKTNILTWINTNGINNKMLSKKIISGEHIMIPFI